MTAATALLLALAVLPQNSLSATGEKPSEIKLIYSDGRTLIQRAGSEGWVAADTADLLRPGDNARTDEESKAEFRLFDSAILRLGPSSSFALLVSAAGAAADSQLTLGELQGNFWVTSLGNGKQRKPIFETPFKEGSAVISSPNDGTSPIFRMEVGVDRTVELKAYQGSVVVSFAGLDSLADSANAANFPSSSAPGMTSTGGLSSIEIKSQEKLLLTSSGQIVYKGPFSQGDIDEATPWVEWNKSRDASLH